MILPRVAIIGGGPGGLMTAHLLERRSPTPLDITLLEASPRLGGKVVTGAFRSHPVPYEIGAAELYDYSQLGQDPLRELIDELGLPTRPMRGGTVVFRDHILKNLDDVSRVLGAPTAKALRAFNRRARSLISRAEYYESDWKADNNDPTSRQSFHDFLKSVPDEEARRFIQIAVHSDLATEPHLTNAMYGLQNSLMDEEDYMRLYTIDGGLERLPRAIAERISARVLLHSPVVKVERLPNEAYRVFFKRAGELVQEDFDFVVVALPNNWIPAVEWGGAQLAAAMHDHHAFYDYPAHYLRVSVLFKRPFWREWIDGGYFMLDAFGGCCVYDESSRADGGAFGVLGWLLGGEAALTLSNFDDETLIEQALDSLPTALRPGRDLFLEGRVQRWVGTVNGLPGGRPAREPDSRHVPEPENHPWLFVVGDYLFDSTLNGVMDSADTVVEWILEDLPELLAHPAMNGQANGAVRGEASAPLNGHAPALAPPTIIKANDETSHVPAS